MGVWNWKRGPKSRAIRLLGGGVVQNVPDLLQDNYKAKDSRWIRAAGVRGKNDDVYIVKWKVQPHPCEPTLERTLTLILTADEKPCISFYMVQYVWSDKLLWYRDLRYLRIAHPKATTAEGVLRGYTQHSRSLKEAALQQREQRARFKERSVLASGRTSSCVTWTFWRRRRALPQKC